MLHILQAIEQSTNNIIAEDCAIYSGEYVISPYALILHLPFNFALAVIIHNQVNLQVLPSIVQGFDLMMPPPHLLAAQSNGVRKLSTDSPSAS